MTYIHQVRGKWYGYCRHVVHVGAGNAFVWVGLQYVSFPRNAAFLLCVDNVKKLGFCGVNFTCLWQHVWDTAVHASCVTSASVCGIT